MYTNDHVINVKIKCLIFKKNMLVVPVRILLTCQECHVIMCLLINGSCILANFVYVVISALIKFKLPYISGWCSPNHASITLQRHLHCWLLREYSKCQHEGRQESAKERNTLLFRRNPKCLRLKVCLTFSNFCIYYISRV